MQERRSHSHLLLAYSLVQAATAGEDDDEGRHGVAEDSAELIIRLLEEPVAAHAEGDLLPARVILDPLDLNPSPPHAGDLS
jgi:hypothetical protein